MRTFAEWVKAANIREAGDAGMTGPITPTNNASSGCVAGFSASSVPGPALLFPDDPLFKRWKPKVKKSVSSPVVPEE